MTLDPSSDHTGADKYHAWLGGSLLEIIDSPGGAPADGCTMVSFTVDDVDATVRRVVAAGGWLDQQATDYAWGRFASLRDPDGNRVGIFSPQSDTPGAS